MNDSSRMRENEGIAVDVDRGPNWLFLKVHPPEKSVPQSMSRIGEQLWSIAAKHFTYRVVLEMEEFDKLPETWSNEISQLQSKLREQGGSLKICGLPHSATSGSLASHNSRDEAIMER